MILDIEVQTLSAQNWQYYKKLGYNTTYGGDKLLVNINHLLHNSHIKINCKCDLCGTNFTRVANKVLRRKLHHCHPCQRKYLGYLGKVNAIKAGKKNCGSNHHNFNPNKTELKSYAYKVRVLSERIYRENVEKLNPNNLPRTLCGKEGGYQLDHIISIKRGFSENIPVEEIARMENLQLIPWQENRKKWA